MTQPQIVWLRRDLRLADQAAFHAAAARGPVIAVYVLDDETPGERRMGGAARWWLYHSLEALERDLRDRGSRLILRRGKVVEELGRLAAETGAASVHALRHYEPWWREAESQLSEQLDLNLYDGNYLLPPGALTTGSGSVYKIFTPFRGAMLSAIDDFDLLPAPDLHSPGDWPASDDLADWNLLPTRPNWASEFGTFWTPGSTEAHSRLDGFAEDDAAEYEERRNLPSEDGTSRLSPHLHHGEISPREVWQRLAGLRGVGVQSFRSELIWRDFAQTLIWQFPDYPARSYREGYDFWRDPFTDPEAARDLKAWQQGRTGYPIVDAGMRQLWHVGWMHNRVRMIAASFLSKHLLIDWRHGERWFWDTLVDADCANNGTNWQWVSGTGVDSNMFVRIMAPLTQSVKFDAAGYIREYVPELAHLPGDLIHDPLEEHWPADYPARIIGHKQARARALSAFKSRGS